jgi:CubicO group peptidase (beta-lactamase class C family)
MTFRHLANMVSGYARGEAPGAAWAYNDVAIQLYARSLERIFGGPLQEAFAGRLGMLQLEDGDFFGSRGGMGVLASVRDFARLGWLWLCRGRWGKQVVLPGALFAACARPGVPPNCPRSAAAGEDYLKVGSYGGGTDQTPHGPGVYGFNWWFNEPVRPGGPRAWPGLPPDAYQANGMWNRDTVTVLPGLRMVAVIRGASPGPFAPGEESAPANRAFALLAAAAG